jgi:hypothetical protein
MRNAYRILMGKPEGKRLLGIPKRGCVYNIKMDLRETGWGVVDWIDLTHDRDKRRALLNTQPPIQWVPELFPQG